MSQENKHEKLDPEQEQTVLDQEDAQNAQPEPTGEPKPEEPKPEKTEPQLLQEKVDELNDRLLRTMAEYDNFRKRSQKEKEAIYPQATAAAVAQFVPILDTFDRALSAPCADEEFKKGVEMILQNFKDVLAKMGVEEFGAPGEQFDPECHNAVMHIEDESFAENSIVEVFQKGYRIGDRVVRHAMVKVAN